MDNALFNPKHTFDTFVVGSSNALAHAAALAAAQSPAKSYNPLFIHGGAGLGKTHLLHAIGQHVLAHTNGARVAYLSSEQFINEYTDALRNRQLGQFRKKYCQADVLLMDDAHLLAGKERMQEELFHIFNALHEAHRQIALTSDRPANEIPNLVPHLVSRFEWGLVTDLQPPDGEMRLVILQKRVALMGMDVPSEVLNFLADHIRSNIRRLEGTLIRVSAYAQLTGKELTVEIAKHLLHEVLYEENSIPWPSTMNQFSPVWKSAGPKEGNWRWN